MSDEIKISVSKKKIKLIGLIVLVLIIGFLIGNFFPIVKLNQSKLKVEKNTNMLNDVDKNFLVTLANSEIQVILNKSDWCTSSGGKWNFVKTEKEIEVSEKEAKELMQNGVNVEKKEGKYYSTFAILNRNACVFPIKK